MDWAELEKNLTKAFTQKIVLPCGVVFLAEQDVALDEWVRSATGESDRINLSPVQFLQLRWPIESLVEMRWPRSQEERSISAMYMSKRAFIIFNDGCESHVIASIEAQNQPELYRIVIDKIFENVYFVPTPPPIVHIRRPDLVSSRDAYVASEPDLSRTFGGENFGGLGGPVDWMHPGRNCKAG
jgi:hypothetical protein